MSKKIKTADLTISVRYLVDCSVCQEGVETDEEFKTKAEAIQAISTHLAEHRAGYWGD